jgi:hypothetical protein
LNVPAASDGNNQGALLQIMTTEHFVLQTARAATVQEANQRANLYLTSVSSATIALAFVAQVTQMGKPFVLFSLIILPCLYFVGLVTFVRAVQVAIEDMVHARGMARIRHYYTELEPVMKDYLVHSTHDDYRAVLANKGFKPSHFQSLVSTAGIVSAVNGTIAGVFTGVAIRTTIGSPINLAVLLGILVSLVSILLLRRYHVRTWADAERTLPTRFPDHETAP